MISDLHGIIAELPLERLARRAKNTRSGEEAVSSDSNGNVSATSTGAGTSGRDCPAKVTTNNTFSLDNCLLRALVEFRHCFEGLIWTFPPKIMFWLPVMVDFLDTLFPVS